MRDQAKKRGQPTYTVGNPVEYRGYRNILPGYVRSELESLVLSVKELARRGFGVFARVCVR